MRSVAVMQGSPKSLLCAVNSNVNSFVACTLMMNLFFIALTVVYQVRRPNYNVTRPRNGASFQFTSSGLRKKNCPYSTCQVKRSEACFIFNQFVSKAIFAFRYTLYVETLHHSWSLTTAWEVQPACAAIIVNSLQRRLSVIKYFLQKTWPLDAWTFSKEMKVTNSILNILFEPTKISLAPNMWLRSSVGSSLQLNIWEARVQAPIETWIYFRFQFPQFL